jgi:hypothetical protein
VKKVVSGGDFGIIITAKKSDVDTPSMFSFSD